MTNHRTPRKISLVMLPFLLAICIAPTICDPCYAYAANTSSDKALTAGVANSQSESSASYRILFNANGGKGSMEDQDMVYDEQQGLFKNNYTRKGYTFAGWNTAEDGNGTSYQDEETVQNLTDQNRVDVILYAQWTPIVYSIQYDLDGGFIRGGAHNPRTYTAEDSFTLLEPEKEDYNFEGWTGTGCEVPQTDVHIGPDDIGDREYKANLELKKYSVIFDTNGGSKVPEQVVTIHGKAKKPVVILTDADGQKIDDSIVSVDYSNNTNAGTATITVTGKGNYSDADPVKVSFRYMAASSDLRKTKIIKSISEQPYTGSYVQLGDDDLKEILYTDSKTDPRDLEPGKDFVVSGYKNNIKKGTAKVTLKGIGAFGGTKTLNFKIIEKQGDYKGALIGDKWQ